MLHIDLETTKLDYQSMYYIFSKVIADWPILKTNLPIPCMYEYVQNVIIAILLVLHSRILVCNSSLIYNTSTSIKTYLENITLL